MIINCTKGDVINLTNQFQSIIQSTIVAVRIKQINDFTSNSRIVTDVNDKVRNTVSDFSWIWYIIIFIIVAVIIYMQIAK